MERGTWCSPWSRTELDMTEGTLHTCMLGFAQYRCSIRALYVKAQMHEWVDE